MIFMASTGISAEKTASEISIILSRSNLVKYIQFEYNEGSITGISFIIMAGAKRLPFKLSARWGPVLDAMDNDRRTPRHLCNPDQARRVAWRQLLRWVQAQMALIEIGMVDIKEIFMSYLKVTDGQTLYESLEKKSFMITADAGK